MAEMEANRVAVAIRNAALQGLHVEQIEPHAQAQRFQIRCRYHGPTFIYERQLFLHGMHIRVNSAYEWKRLRRILSKN